MNVVRPLAGTSLVLALGFFGCGGNVETPPSGSSRSPLALHVVDGNGVPIGGLPVLVAGRVVVTDAAGAIAVDGVAAPYDVAFRMPSGMSVYAYQGLTKRDLTIKTTWATGRRTMNEAQVKVAPRSDGVATATLAYTNEGTGESLPATPSDAWTFFWQDGAAPTAHFQAVAYTSDPNGAPTYVAIAKGEVALDPNVTTEWTPAWSPLAPADMRTIATSATIPAGATGAKAKLGSHRAGFSLPPAPVAADGRITLAAPPLDGFDLATTASWHGGSISEYDFDIDPTRPPAPELTRGIDLLAPADGATGIGASNELSFQAPGPVVIDLTPIHSSAPTINIYAAGTAHLPDLAALGFSGMQGAQYRWSVSFSSVADSVEAWAEFSFDKRAPRIRLARSAERTLTLE